MAHLRSDMACMFPFSVQNPRYGMPNEPHKIPVPCGKCPSCLIRRVNEWSFRLQFEERRHKSASFVTLTYERPPMTRNGYMTLRKLDVQNYLKRLRFAHKEAGIDTGVGIKYYGCGEYGSRFSRPHYHYIVFGSDPDLLETVWSGFENVNMDTGEVVSVNGSVFIGAVTGASIGYTLKYMHKGKIIPQHDRDDRVPEFALMSKRLGADYVYSEHMKSVGAKFNSRLNCRRDRIDTRDYHRADDTRTYLLNPDGYKVPMPRYYRERFWTPEERRKAGLKLADREASIEAKRRQAYIDRTGSIDGYDLAVHESKKAAITNFRKRAKEKRKDV